MNANYNINSDLFFDIDDDSLRGHEKIVQRRFRLDVTKYVFSNRVVNNWNAFP